MKINFSEVITRLKSVTGASKNYEVAEMFGISPSDFSKRIKSGSALNLIVEWAIQKDVDLNWLFYGTDVCLPDSIHLIQASKILSADNEFSEAFKKCIEALSVGIDGVYSKGDRT